MMREFIREISMDKIKINWNKNPIKMELFLSMLTIETRIPDGDWLGKCRGWTEHEGDGDLMIRGGIVKGVEYLDSIIYGKNLHNPYNNYVNPFCLFDILTDEGKTFFLEYHADDINNIINKRKEKADAATKNYNETLKFWESMGAGDVISVMHEQTEGL